MAALYLHHALFTNDTPAPSVAPRTGRVLPHNRQLSSFSSVTLQEPSEMSHASTPLFDTYADSPVYQDLLSRQPPHPLEGSAITELTFEGDPITHRERRGRWEKGVRTKLRRLKWARRLLTVIIAAWAVYNTVRYFVAFTVYTSHGRQIAVLVLGTVTVLSFTLIVVARLLALFAPHLGWKQKPSSPYPKIQAALRYAASALQLGPPIANIVLAFVWKHAPDTSESLQGRCHWDIDVSWSGRGFECDARDAVSWGFWLAGALVRLLVTALVIAGYHFVSHLYFVTRRPSRHRGGRTHSHSISFSSSGADPFLAAPSIRSSRTMLSTTTAPVSVPYGSRQPSRSTSESDLTRESFSGSSSADHHPILRRSSSRIGTSQKAVPESRTRQSRQSLSGRSQPSSDGHVEQLADPHYASANSSEEDFSTVTDPNSTLPPLYGRQVRQLPGAYSVIPPSSLALEHLAEQPQPALHDGELRHFVERFRELMDEVSRETDAGLELAQNDQPGYYIEADPNAASSMGAYTPFPSAEDDSDFVPVVGRIIQRMPTIESLGSREVMSLSSWPRGDRSVHSTSRPPTRSNTLTWSETAGSQPVSRSNSLTASVVLSSPVDSQPPVNELGQFSGTPSSTYNGSHHGSKSTASYYTAVTGTNSSADSAALL